MSRRRYLSTNISLDPELDEVAKKSDFAALLYTWMIPHADDDATICGDPKKFKALVIPHRDDKTPDEVREALELLESEGMFEKWDRHGKRIYLHPESFYRIQSMIPKEKRRQPLAR